MLMTAATFSMLCPSVDKNDPFYKEFYLQYSLFTASNYVMYQLVSLSKENTISELFDSLNEISNDYQLREIFLTCMGFESSTPQKNEQRALNLDLLFADMHSMQIEQKKILYGFININEFILLYALFEGIIKKIFRIKGYLKERQFLKENEIITSFQESFDSQLSLFLRNLNSRIPLLNFEEINLFWLLFTMFRHLFLHSGGFVTQQWFDKYRTIKEKLFMSLSNCHNEQIIDIDNLISTIDKFNIELNKLFYPQDIFVNIFRNFIVAFMESMYLSDISSIE